MIAKVIIDLSLDKVFDYIIPEALEAFVEVGSRVHIPFGNSLRKGFVLDIQEKSDYPDLKAIKDISQENIKIPVNLIKLGNWMSEYYCCSKEHSIRTLLPSAVRSGRVTNKIEKTYSISDMEAANNFIQISKDKKSCQKRIKILQYLIENQEVGTSELNSEFSNPSSVLKTLLKDNLIIFEDKIIRNDLFAGRKTVMNQPLKPSREQQKALDLIQKIFNKETKNLPVLLHGVTNSGKTEVYLQAIAMAIKLDLQSIMLVPEISLTPQTVRRFRARFGDDISVLHSRLTDRERFDEWMRIKEQKVKIVVGARSALFSPLEKLGLIIVDEEHESSYKQSESPRYHARDVAVMRGYLEKALVILGSATPSVESYYNALNNKYHLVEMNAKVDDKAKPIVRIIDQRLQSYTNDDGKTMSSFFSPYLIESVFDRIRRGEQTILFLNRRGYARVMSCELCGYEARCNDCAISYTYSKKNETLTCHLCGDVINAPELCPSCQAPNIRYLGVGTEKIENVAMGIFKDARIGRMDSDTMKSTEAYEQTLNKFKRGDLDILIGTQMIAKGLHFPNVTLVGIINADQGLAMPDFRAAEKNFQLLTQVAGRAGRGEIQGEVIIQSYNPDNETILFASENDYKSFYKYDIEAREIMLLPPFGHMMIIHFASENEQLCIDYAQNLREAITPLITSEMRVTGPKAAPIERIKGKYRYMISIRGNKLKQLREYVRMLVMQYHIPKDLHVYIDVDAQFML